MLPLGVNKNFLAVIYVWKINIRYKITSDSSHVWKVAEWQWRITKKSIMRVSLNCSWLAFNKINWTLWDENGQLLNVFFCWHSTLYTHLQNLKTYVGLSSKNRKWTLCCHYRCAFGLRWKMKIISLFSLFFYYLWASLYFLAQFIGFIVLFQLIFIFIYHTFSNNFSSSTN